MMEEDGYSELPTIAAIAGACGGMNSPNLSSSSPVPDIAYEVSSDGNYHASCQSKTPLQLSSHSSLHGRIRSSPFHLQTSLVSLAEVWQSPKPSFYVGDDLLSSVTGRISLAIIHWPRVVRLCLCYLLNLPSYSRLPLLPPGMGNLILMDMSSEGVSGICIFWHLSRTAWLRSPASDPLQGQFSLFSRQRRSN